MGLELTTLVVIGTDCTDSCNFPFCIIHNIADTEIFHDSFRMSKIRDYDDADVAFGTAGMIRHLTIT